MTVVALAGRRIDSEGAEIARFPLDQAEKVKEQLRTVFRTLHPSRLVCSAACGADLLALEAAGELGIPATIVLPFECQRFRTTSVTDRPGNWGPRFDGAMRQAQATGSVEVISTQATGDDEAYTVATTAILDDAQELAKVATAAEPDAAGNQVVAVVVWDGSSRDETDLTDIFRREAVRRKFSVREVLTTSMA